MPFKGFPDVDSYVAFGCFEQTRTEGDVTTHEVVDRIDSRQLESRIVGSFDNEAAALALRDQLRRKYATKLELGVPV